MKKVLLSILFPFLFISCFYGRFDQPEKRDSLRLELQENPNQMELVEIYWGIYASFHDNMKDSLIPWGFRALREIDALIEVQKPNYNFRLLDLKGKTMNRLSENLTAMGHLEQRDSLMEEILDFFRDKEYNNPIGHVYLRLGVELSYGDDLDSARGLLLKAKSIFEESDDFFGIYRAHYQLCPTYYYEGNIKEALYHSKEMFRFLEKFGNDSHNMGQAFLTKGDMYLQMKDYEKSLEAHFKAQKFTRISGDNGTEGIIHYNIGQIFLETGQYEKAEEYTLKSLVAATRRKSPWAECWAYGQLGKIYLKTGKTEEALKNFLLLKEVSAKLNSAQSRAEGNQGLGMTYTIMGRYAEAEKLLGDALKFFTKGGFYAEIAETHHQFGELYINWGKYSKGIKHCNKVFEIGKEHNINAIKMAGCDCQWKLYKKKGDFGNALSSYQLFEAYKDSVQNSEKVKNLEIVHANFELELNENERIRKEEMEAAILFKETQRRNKIQYAGIFIGIVLLVGVVILMAKVRIPENLVEGLVFFVLLLFFEFILIVVDPYVMKYISDMPLLILSVNAGIAIAITPLHNFIEEWMSKKLASR